MLDGMPITRHTKINGDMSIEETNTSILEFAQLDHFEPLIRRGNDASRLFRRLMTPALAVNFKQFKDIEKLDQAVQHKPCKIFEISINDEALGKKGCMLAFSGQVTKTFDFLT